MSPLCSLSHLQVEGGREGRGGWEGGREGEREGGKEGEREGVKEGRNEVKQKVFILSQLIPKVNFSDFEEDLATLLILQFKNQFETIQENFSLMLT